MKFVTINNHIIGEGKPVYIIAEISANHNQSFEEAVRIIEFAKAADADAVKLQTYTPDTITIQCDNSYFRIGKGTIWEGCNLYNLYSQAFTPWELQPKLKIIAENLGLDFFSTPFDISAVDFLEEIGVPAYKIASFELVDIPLIRKVAMTGKPIIISTGMASLEEIEEALNTAYDSGSKEIVILKCTSAYPAPADEINLRTIPDMANRFKVPVGISDHSLGISVPIAAVALGACIVEKHLTITRSIPGPDSSFSLEPDEFRDMVNSIRTTEKALGRVNYEITMQEKMSRTFRRSIFAVEDIKAGERFTELNIRSIRPFHGLHTRYLNDILGKYASCDISRGEPLSWNMVTNINKGEGV